MERIVWIHNFSYPEYIGGAELTDFYWIQKGKELGINLMETKYDSIDVPLGDAYILGNTGKFDSKLLLKKIGDKPYVCIVHGGIVSPESIELYKKATALIFMSPEQKKRFSKTVVDNKISLIIPPYIDTKKFYDFREPRIQNSYLFVGAIREHKGIQTILSYAKDHPGFEYHFYGPTKSKEIYLLEMIKALPNCEYHGIISNEDLPKIMNKYETFIWFLNLNFNDFESFGRTIVEALLCGMRIKADKKEYGAFSWNWNFNNPKEVAKKLEEYYSNFWDEVLKTIRLNSSQE